jgi:hypothetical protein
MGYASRGRGRPGQTYERQAAWDEPVYGHMRGGQQGTREEEANAFKDYSRIMRDVQAGADVPKEQVDWANQYGAALRGRHQQRGANGLPGNYQSRTAANAQSQGQIMYDPKTGEEFQRGQDGQYYPTGR